jgi:hypothetical protein
MPRRFDTRPRDPDLMRWSDVPNFYWLAMGVAVLIGLVGGSIWIAWKLLEVHVLK